VVAREAHSNADAQYALMAALVKLVTGRRTCSAEALPVPFFLGGRWRALARTLLMRATSTGASSARGQDLVWRYLRLTADGADDASPAELVLERLQQLVSQGRKLRRTNAPSSPLAYLVRRGARR